MGSVIAPRKHGRRGIVASASVGIVVFLVVYGLGRPSSLLGRPAPVFDLTSYSGDRLLFKDFSGQVIVVNFWASWCEPCQAEAASLERVWADFRDQPVVFVGINCQDTPASAREFLEHYRITYPNAPDPYGRLMRAYGVTALPETFVVGADGAVVKRYIGAVNEAELARVIAETLP